MRVLLVTADLYRLIGGGQTVYRKIIESTPEVDFYYFRAFEREGARRAANSHAIPMAPARNIKTLYAPKPPDLPHLLREVDQFARSVRGQSFDIVDSPDYYPFGVLLRDAFKYHNVQVGRYVLAMHGNISTSLRLSWGAQEDMVCSQEPWEREQFLCADSVYAISRMYMDEWRSHFDREIFYIDPMNFVDVVPPSPNWDGAKQAQPDLCCIGRLERRKGNDLFLELARWIDPELYGSVVNVGDDEISKAGISGRCVLENMARNRGIRSEFRGPYQASELARIFSGRALVVLPVRYDTLNLVALEALFSGCPVAISSAAGVCRYLDETFPQLPYIKIDFNNFYEAVGQISDALRNYNEYRRRLLDRLSTIAPAINSTLNMYTLFGQMLEAPPSPEATKRKYFWYDSGRVSMISSLKIQLKKTLPESVSAKLKWLMRTPIARMRDFVRSSGYRNEARLAISLLKTFGLPSLIHRIEQLRESSQAQLTKKLRLLYATEQFPIFRGNFWLEMARLERRRGEEMVALAYELRLLRLLGKDTRDLLPRVLQSLVHAGFEEEAGAAEAMFGDPEHAKDRVYRYLHEARERNMRKPDLPFERLDDRRSASMPKVSVIVSLYNAAPKLKVFLTCLTQQTLYRRGLVELVFVDSGSPDSEYDTLIDYAKGHTGLNMLYARSAQRETIQAAWNRGIRLARADYLVFLGVDETLYPEALEALASELDSAPDVDWVMADSLVTSVTEQGVLDHEIMTYDRNGATKDHAYLETCFLSWVGGMYRKSIHERFGYYDETFAAAGDTEFKNRVLPYINVSFVRKTLGLFLNYPDQRKTASVRAEIEDLRAWYIYRTPGGVRYAFENRSLADGVCLLKTSLGYRKSYFHHISSDIEYAAYIADYLAARDDSATVIQLKGDLHSMLRLQRMLEFSDSISLLKALGLSLKTFFTFKAMQKKHRDLLKADGAIPTYTMINDNRHEQHFWVWKTFV